MNKVKEEAELLVSEIISSAPETDSVKLFFPPFPFISIVASLIHGNNRFFLGAQNCSEHASGAYTGEVSASMLRSAGCTHVLIGHSERRQYFNESSAVLKEKCLRALENNLTPVFCIGELLDERKSGKHFAVVKDQLNQVLSGLSNDQLLSFIIAYEPVWAIGTGETATPQQAQEMHAFIRKCLAEISNQKVADSISVLYGGSCNAQNAAELFSCSDIDGGLIGGASLKSADFCKIIASMP